MRGPGPAGAAAGCGPWAPAGARATRPPAAGAPARPTRGGAPRPPPRRRPAAGALAEEAAPCRPAGTRPPGSCLLRMRRRPPPPLPNRQSYSGLSETSAGWPPCSREPPRRPRCCSPRGAGGQWDRCCPLREPQRPPGAARRRRSAPRDWPRRVPHGPSTKGGLPRRPRGSGPAQRTPTSPRRRHSPASPPAHRARRRRRGRCPPPG